MRQLRRSSTSRFAGPVVLFVLAVGGCGDDGPERFAARRAAQARAKVCAAPPETAPSTTHETGTSEPQDEPVVAFDLMHEFSEPVDAAVRPGVGGAVFVLEKAGQVYELGLDGSAAVIVGDFTTLIDTVWWDPAGALGLEFSPDGHYAYVHYIDRAGYSVIAEFPVGTDGRIQTAAERQLIRIAQHAEAWHFGGDLAFGADGMLYIPLGDGDSGLEANGGDPERVAHDPFELLGSILRIDPKPSATKPYSVPADNPFADGELGAPEVWSWGLRNPWKFTFDRETGDLWVADVGFSDVEEVTLVRQSGTAPAGRCANFGWSEFEGSIPLHRDAHGPGHLVFPAVTFGHDLGCSIAGAAVYRGSWFESLQGWFLYSDLCRGSLWAYDAATGTNRTLATEVGSVVAVREGPDGELIVIDHNGPVYRVVPADDRR